ncbi:hypothetical protein DLM86_04790 [Paenibacillus flagellatus]|uniref:Uncharacterized protein n=2 Tax=Paenibacillus flagellatus TaxID=2211139 RepID=A0A2V5KE34_9BACL|nr:hypothetical protein DLM86_04790 [Paenibacillus flagellatus]
MRPGMMPPLAQPAGESELSERLYRMLLKWIRYADAQYADWPERPNSGHFFGGAYWYGIETAYTAMVFAAAARLGDYDERLTGLSREEVKAKAIRAIRYLGFTHDTGPEECVRTTSRNPYCSGKKWGGRGDTFFRASQTGTVVHAFGCAAWLLRDDLDDETKRLVEAVLVYYADRWSGEEPRSGVYYDTQCEENGWTAAGIGTAATLLPDHPRNAVWREAAERWAINSVSTPNDRIERVPGMTTVTFHPDYTAENHAFVHPSYMMAGISLRGYYALLLLMSDRDVPEALTRNNVPMYERTIKPWSSADGIPVPVQGQDWWYNVQHGALLCHAYMNVLHGDADAARLERASLEFAEKLQDSNSRGCLLEENGEACIVVAESYQTAKEMEFGSAHSLLVAYLLHRFGGPGAEPAEEADWRSRMNGVRHYPYGCAITHTTDRAFASFSWRSHVMATTLPRQGMWSVTPLYTNYTGEVEFADEPPSAAFNESKAIRTSRCTVREYGDGFGATADIERGRDGKLLQRVAFVSLPDGRTLYAEKIAVLRPCSVKRLATGTIGIRNERYSALAGYAAGFKTVTTPDGAKRYDGFYGKEPDVVDRFGPAPYVNVNGEVGYVTFGSAGMAYWNRHHYPKWKGVEDVLTLNERAAIDFAAPAELPAFAVLTVPNASAAETEAAAATTRLLTDPVADCVVVEADGWLLYANWNDKGRTSYRAAAPRSGTSVPLYEGGLRLTADEIVRTGTIEPAAAGYATSRHRLELLTDVVAGSGIDVDLLGGRLFATNDSPDSAVRIAVTETGTGRRVELAVGPKATAALPLEDRS